MQRLRRPQPRRGGFTLLEILIVLSIIGVIAAMVVPQLIGQQREANIKASRANIKGLESAVKLYAVSQAGQYPQGGQEALTVLLQPTVGSDGRTTEPLLRSVPMDAWQRPLFYEYPNTKSNIDEPAIWSAGPNGINENGAGDDINNWSQATSL
ncbi:MAG: type II secretion system major pseudopilin GspG [Planctomyces sp.]|nr:type II secretion system major pseudopilin GspG [Planctomyces sp.]